MHVNIYKCFLLSTRAKSFALPVIYPYREGRAIGARRSSDAFVDSLGGLISRERYHGA